MTTITVLALVHLVMAFVVAGVLLAEPGKATTTTYGWRWYGVLHALVAWGVVLLLAGRAT